MHSVPAEMLRSCQPRNLKRPPRRRPYCCDACTKQFETPSKLARHYLSHTGLKPFPCPDCSNTFRQLAHLERHMMTHMLPLRCDTCLRHFKTFETFSKHQQLPCAGPVEEVRAPKRSPAPAHRSIRSLPQSCFGCQRTFASEEKCLLHQCEFLNLAAIHKVQTRCCEFCDKVFPSRSKLERHLMIHTGQKPFICSLCDRTFRQKTHLKIHALTHSEEKPFQCLQCPKAFKMAEKLLRHQAVHKISSTIPRREWSPSGEPVEVKQEAEEAFSSYVTPFQCSSCGQCFEKQENLDNHECITEAVVSEAATSARGTYKGGSKVPDYLLDNEILPDGRVMKAETLEEPNHMDAGRVETQHHSVSKNFLHIRKPQERNIQQPGTDLERYFPPQELGMNFHGLLENGRGDAICSTFHAYDQDQHGQQSHSLHQFLQGAQGILLRKHRVVKCDQCSKTFPSMSKLRRHYLIHTGQKPFMCTECGKTFRQTTHLKRHLVIHDLKAPVLGLEGTLGDYYSTLCQQTISFSQSQHYDPTVNTDELDQVKTIDVPDMKVESESMDLERSAKSNPEQKVRTQAVKKSYKCSVCSKNFHSPSKLERHYLMHAGQKPFQCIECGQSFRQDPHLKRHMVMHIRMKKKIEDGGVS
ncbi:zinc finger protein 770 [Ranitomeya variabilis]|uniref:zinc finger protein 770 n=1 Tax=Ranitomeya variabilis TaxID=490064 RepID=UPI0040574CB2